MNRVVELTWQDAIQAVVMLIQRGMGTYMDTHNLYFDESKFKEIAILRNGILIDLREDDDPSLKGQKSVKRYTLKKCPDCKTHMILVPVNNTPATQTGDPSDKSQWVCNNKDCMSTIFNKQTTDEIHKQLEEQELKNG